jgi:hypothetical protein
MPNPQTVRRIRDEVRRWKEQYYPSDGDAFAHVAMRTFFELDDDEALEACDVGGPNDRGLDAYVHDAEERQVIVAQAKYAAKAKSFNREAISDLTSAWTTLKQIATQETPRAREQVVAAARDIATLRNRDPAYPVGLYCFAAGHFTQQAIDLKDAFNEEHASEGVVMYLIDMDALADALETTDSKLGDKPVGDIELELKEHFHFSTAANEPTTVVAAVDCLRLAEIERQFQYRIFQRNVRFFLTARQRENKGIARTLATSGGRGRFWFYNNGISIVCDAVDVDEKRSVATVRNMQIVNGCQTTSTLGENIDKLRDPEQPAHVLVRIVAAADDELQQLISLYNNRQNQVKDRDLQSNEDQQARLQREFDRLDDPWFYERKRGEWDARVKSNSAIKRRYGTRRLDNEKVAQAAYAFHVDPGIARARKANLFVRQADDPEKGLYETIFNDATTPEWLLLPYLLSEEIAKRRSEFMRELKKALAVEEPSNADLAVRRREWTKFADQYFLGAIGFYIRERGPLDERRLAALLEPDTFQELFKRAYAQARGDLTAFFANKHAEADRLDQTFVAANWVKGNWDKTFPLLMDRAMTRSEIGEDLLATIPALSND